jgi:hypothetical protein
LFRASPIPAYWRPGSTVYFSVDGCIVCSVISIDLKKVATKWLRYCFNREKDRWRWKAIKPALALTWIGLREADAFERIAPPTFHSHASWVYVQLDPSPRQRRINAQLVQQYLQERKNEWPSQPMGS